MRSVLDTNIYVYAFVVQRDPSRKILQAGYRREYTPLVSNAIVAEILNILWARAEEEHFDSLQKKELMRKLSVSMSWAESVKVKTRVNYCVEDPSDNKFIGCAIDGGGDFIVSNDKEHILPLREMIKEKHSIDVVSPDEFLHILYRQKVQKARK